MQLQIPLLPTRKKGGGRWGRTNNFFSKLLAFSNIIFFEMRGQSNSQIFLDFDSIA